MNNLIEDTELSFKLLEYSIRNMCYAELGEIDADLFGQDLQLNLDEESVSYSSGEFKNQDSIVRASQMAVSTAFGATAICLDCILEKVKSDDSEIKIIKSLISATRNAFSHGIASPEWFVKPHKFEVLDLSFVGGIRVNLENLNRQPFDYSQIGGLAVWYRVKSHIILYVSNT
ncbi:hypothetical protein WNY98_04435 [Pseudoalteromonas sp. AS71]|uniref:hypothetical protein n=1 Tax=Pseudoalteromonas sp. AS71 TaxID=3135777 RepID=UPI00317A9CF3